ncbi:MAG TPA: NAD-dependent epimerase/dehydratase family protein [Sandaracinaceae bacterium LLY-WYZ-13_1]|nr:NAD-dependent epimerase/dehydratase family protein [Sandaracinaceae bacterium LLY-WYZ-13_1]
MKVLLTGGGGFLGRAIAARLAARGHEVRSFSRGTHAVLDELGIPHVRGDLANRQDVLAAAAGCDAIVHTAAKAGVWGDYESYRRANLDGTRNVLAACRRHQVPRLLYTSTPSVAHTGGDIEGGDETLPYCTEPKTPYQATKTQAEQEVLAAQGGDLQVVALRPHLIWGPGDPHLVPRILERGRSGRIALPGGGRQRVDTTYVDNAADAHVAALERLRPGASCAGRAYFITNGEPRPLRTIVLGILEAAGVHARVVPVPRRVASAAGAALEAAFRWAGSEREPPLTRFVVEQLCTAHWFDISAAERDLGWTPAVGIDEGLARLRASFEGEPAREPTGRQKAQSSTS